MLPIFHPEPMLPPAGLLAGAEPMPRQHSAGTLADAFTAFMQTSAQLEASYRNLQGEVKQLHRELAERNAALKRSRDENKQMREALEQIVASMPSGVLVIDATGAVSLMNPEAGRLLGVAPSAARSLDAIAAATGVSLRALSAIDGQQEFAVGPLDRRCWVQMRTRSLASDDPGRPSQKILVLQDVTAQREAEAEREATRRAHALAEVAATLAHEIRNPLASLELFVGLLSEDAGTAGGRTTEWIEHLRAGIRLLAASVHNVLSFRGGAAPSLAPIELGETIAAGVAFVAPVAAQSEVALHYRGAERPLTVMGNANAMQQMVLNLVINATRHTPPGGEITVAVERGKSGHAVLTVRDTGCGIAAAHLPELFRAGFSASGAGSGLGLAVCRQIAEQHGGTITASSAYGQGATFRVELPRA